MLPHAQLRVQGIDVPGRRSPRCWWKVTLSVTCLGLLALSTHPPQVCASEVPVQRTPSTELPPLEARRLAHRPEESAVQRLIIENDEPGRPVPPGVVGWGAMWKGQFLVPRPPAEFTDNSHRAYIRHLGLELAPLIREADIRHVSWPWGVSFSTWGVNWENSVGPWSQRKRDCARLVFTPSGWCETAIVGVEDLMELAAAWELEAITVSVPLAVLDGSQPRWGPGFTTQAFSEDTIDKITDHAVRLIRTLEEHPAWDEIPRIYLAAGCEWRHYKLDQAPSPAVLTYAALVRRIRESIPHDKVIVVASASDSMDLPGTPRLQALNWNPHLHRELAGTEGVALDLHRYRGFEATEPTTDGTTPMTPENVDALLATGVRQRGYLQVRPEHWGAVGEPLPTVLLENGVRGEKNTLDTQGAYPIPWPVAMAHADLVREALATPVLSFLGWTLFPEEIPQEWPSGALVRDGEPRLSAVARAQAFLSEKHRGEVLVARVGTGAAGGPIRANATRHQGAIHAYGGNFSRQAHSVRIHFGSAGPLIRPTDLEILTEGGILKPRIGADGEFTVPPLSLFRLTLPPD